MELGGNGPVGDVVVACPAVSAVIGEVAAAVIERFDGGLVGVADVDLPVQPGDGVGEGVVTGTERFGGRVPGPVLVGVGDAGVESLLEPAALGVENLVGVSFSAAGDQQHPVDAPAPPARGVRGAGDLAPGVGADRGSIGLNPSHRRQVRSR